MRNVAFVSSLALALSLAGAAALAADNYKVDTIHSSSVFRIKHANTSYFWGRFNDPTGSFALDEADVTRSTFSIELDVTKVDTGNDKRDAHLKSPDFFNAKQYPKITFKSTSAKKGEAENTLDVAGELTMHGVTKPVIATVELTGKGEFPPGAKRAGIEATIVVKMTDFEMKAMPGALSDEVKVIVALAGVKQ